MKKTGGFTYVEVMVAVAIVAIFFGALYALNANCLYLLSAGRQAAAAAQSLQDRLEQFRRCSWTQLTDASYIKNNILNTSTTSGYNIAGSTETVTLNTYPLATTTPTTIVRANGTTTTISTNSNLVNTDLVRIDVALNWSSNVGKRARSQSISSLIAKNVP